MNKEIEQGKRTGLPLSYRFIPACITSRGVMGESMEKLLDWLSDYGVKNRSGRGGSAGQGGAQEALDPAHLDCAAPDHDGGSLVSGAGQSGRRELPEGRPNEPDGH